MVRQTRLHRGRYAERVVDAAEVKKGHVEMHGGLEMRKVFAKAQAKPRKAPQVRPKAQIGAVPHG